VTTEPPVDPEEWTDEQWLAWLAEQDDAAARSDGGGDEDAPPERPPRRIPTESFGAQIIGGAMKGLAEALYGPQKKDVEIVSEAPGDPLDEDPLELHLDQDHPEDSRAIIRPWRRKKADPG
jgi:hypothetical protein